MTPEVNVNGTEVVVSRFRAMPDSLRAGLRREVARLAFEVTASAVASVSGPLLKRRTGALAGSINPTVFEGNGEITAIVSAGGIAAKYAGIHEYGFDGREPVKAHLRTITQAWGRPLKYPVHVQVGAFERDRKVPEKAYLRGALRKHKEEILSSMAGVAARVAQGASS